MELVALEKGDKPESSGFVFCVTSSSSSLPGCAQGTQNFGGIRVGNGPTEDQAEIIQHDQLSQHSEEEPEVRRTRCGA